MITTWSWSRLEVFEKCPYQAYLKFYEKRPEPPDPRRDAALSRGQLLHQGAEDYIKGVIGDDTDLKPFTRVLDCLQEARQLFAEGRAQVEAEWAFTVEWQPTGWWDEGVWARIKPDVILFREPGDDSVAEVIDWKSGKKEGNEVKHLQQGQLYAAAAFVQFPALDACRVSFRYFDHNEKLVKSYSRAKGAQFIDSFSQRARKMTEATNFPAKPNKINCRYCPYGINKGDRSCPHAVEI